MINKSFTYPPNKNVIISFVWEIRFWNSYLPTFWLDVIKYPAFLFDRFPNEHFFWDTWYMVNAFQLTLIFSLSWAIFAFMTSISCWSDCTVSGWLESAWATPAPSVDPLKIRRVAKRILRKLPGFLDRIDSYQVTQDF